MSSKMKRQKEMWLYTRMLIQWAEQVSKVLKNIGTKRTLLIMIRRQIFWNRMRKVSLKNLTLAGHSM